MAKCFIGIDNGVTGTIACISSAGSDFSVTPIKKEQNYTKKKDIISRVDVNALRSWLETCLSKHNVNPSDCIVILERPMVNPTRFKATVSAVRALEATICVVESLQLPLMYIDSREWQKVILPKGAEGDELKKLSADIGCRLYPQFSDLIKKHKDADGLLIAHWASKHV